MIKTADLWRIFGSILAGFSCCLLKMLVEWKKGNCASIIFTLYFSVKKIRESMEKGKLLIYQREQIQC